MKRRNFFKTATGFATGSILIPSYSLNNFFKSPEEHYPAKNLTKEPGYHWFGYYDKLQVDHSGRYVLGMQVPFEMRSPEADDEITIGMIDLNDKDRWIELGKSRSWGWQQGCMLQWVPGSSDEIIWNDRDGDRFISSIYNIKTGQKRILPKAIYALSPDGTWAIGTEFSRIQNLRPGYGYAGIADPYETIKAPKQIGLYKINLKTGENRMLFSIADMAVIPHLGISVEDNYHWFNHLLINTDGTRFTFLHRWRKAGNARQNMSSGGFTTRMFTASAAGEDIFLIDPSGFTSHFVWSNPTHICAWTRPAGEKDGFYLLGDKTGSFTPVGEGIMTLNGHNTYVPGTNNEWILCDTYPQGPERLQELYLFHIPSNHKVVLGKFHSPSGYTGEWRCDLHPKCTQDGKKVIFDSTHGGNGRQIYIVEISGLLG
jgi:hypothetical protein